MLVHKKKNLSDLAYVNMETSNLNSYGIIYRMPEGHVSWWETEEENF